MLYNTSEVKLNIEVLVTVTVKFGVGFIPCIVKPVVMSFCDRPESLCETGVLICERALIRL